MRENLKKPEITVSKLFNEQGNGPLSPRKQA